MVKFIIVERTICDAISSAREGPAPFTPPRQRREAMPWSKISEGDADGNVVAAKSSRVGKISNAADDKPAHKKEPGRSDVARVATGHDCAGTARNERNMAQKCVVANAAIFPAKTIASASDPYFMIDMIA